MRKNPNEELFTQYLEQARQNASPEKSYGKMGSTLEGVKFSRDEILQPYLFSGDSLLVDNPQDFQLALEIIQRTFPWVTDEYIQETVEHETEHIQAGIGRFSTHGNKSRFFYGVRFLNMENGNLGVYPFYIGFFADDIAEGPTNEDREFITRAPRKYSTGDKRDLGSKDFDISEGYE